MTEFELNTLLRFFKALANENRLKMLGILADKECSVEELAALLDLKEPTTSHHLSKLKTLGLVQMRTDGNTHLYRLDSDGLQTLNKHIFTPEQMAAMVKEKVSPDSWEQKVLENFMEDGRLKTIPASRKKRVVILEWLAKKFEPTIRYPEAEVNGIIEQYHPDYATIRRELIGHNLMAREQGIYWRLPKAPNEAR